MTQQTNTPETTADNTATQPAPKLTKKAMVEQLLKSDKGATIDDIVKQTSWQKHTVRGHLSILKKAGTEIVSERVDGVRRYQIITP